MIDDGLKLRIGVLVPSGNTVHQQEFARVCPTDVGFEFRGFNYPPADADFCDGLIRQMQVPIASLKASGVALILVGCTTASMLCADDEHHQRLQKLAGIPVVTAAQASSAAAAALNAQTLAVATPYGAANNKIVMKYLQAQGLSVTAIEGLDLDRSLEVWLASAATLKPEQVLELAMAVDSPEAQALYLPCTGIHSLQVIHQFEQRTGKPAFSSVQAGFWASLTQLGYPAPLRGCGRLLENWPV